MSAVRPVVAGSIARAPRDRLESLRQNRATALVKAPTFSGLPVPQATSIPLQRQRAYRRPKAGLMGYEQTIWFGLNAPAGTPAAAIECLNGDLDAILASQQMKNGTGTRQDTILRMDAPALARPAHERRRGGPTASSAAPVESTINRLVNLCIEQARADELVAARRALPSGQARTSQRATRHDPGTLVPSVRLDARLTCRRANFRVLRHSFSKPTDTYSRPVRRSIPGIIRPSTSSLRIR